MRLGQRHQLSEHILVVFPVPDLAHLACRIVQLREFGIDIRVDACLWLVVPRSPEFPQPINQNRLQPTPKSTWLSAMLELAKILRDSQHDFLNKVVCVAVLHVISSQPDSNQRRIEICQPSPTIVLRRLAQAFKKTERGFMHDTSRLYVSGLQNDEQACLGLG